MGATAALKLRSIADNLSDILAIELLCAAQAVDLRRKRTGRNLQLGSGTAPIYEQIRKAVPFIESDEYMKDHIEACRKIVADFVSTKE
jgi:histidine ammonia-lyase